MNDQSRDTRRNAVFFSSCGVAVLAIGLLGADSPPGVAHNPYLKDAYTFADVVSEKVVPNDPGSPPPFDPAEYERYAKPGSATLIGAPFVKTSDGAVHRCIVGNLTFLYPATAYTIWMLNKYAHYVYTTGYEMDPAQLTRSPASLSIFPPDKTLVHWSDCGATGDGTFRFDNLPSGKYIANMFLRVPTAFSYGNTQTEFGSDMRGEPAMVSVYTPLGVAASLGDGWIVTAGVITIPGPGTWKVEDGAWTTAAHLSGGNMTPPASKRPRI